MYDRDREPRYDGEMNPGDIPRDGGTGGRDVRTRDYDGSAPEYRGAAMNYDEGLPPNGSDSRPLGRRRNGGPQYTNGRPHHENFSSYEVAANEYPDEGDDASHGYASPAKSARSASRFLDDTSADFDDSVPLEPAKTSRIRTLGFFLLMAFIGSSAGALWFFYGPDLASSSIQADKTTESLNRLADEQTRLIQSVTALQAAQDALQKTIAVSGQELQRLSAETQALRSDVNAIRTGLADTALHPPRAQLPKSAPAPSKKAKAERKPAVQREQPQTEARPTALSPPSQ
jgi:RAQPRD family integrative conjugative element protein